MHRIRSRSYLAVLLTLSLAPALAAQQTGRIVGRIVESGQGAPIAGAQVQVTGTDIHTVSAIDGRYTLQNVPVGPVSLTARMLGYAPKTVTGLIVTSKDVVEQNIALGSSTVQLEELAVTAEAEKGSVQQALEEQRNSTSVTNATTAEQIAKSPDGDASQAVQRVSGVSVLGGKYVVVRGLGERYTTTNLNGSRLTGAEPEKKVVPLDVFPSALLGSVTTVKTFTPDQSGDFAGAQVNLKTRDFPAQRLISLSVNTGFNTLATGAAIPRAPTVGTEWIGNPGQARAIPEVAAAAGNVGTLAPPDRVPVTNSFRNVWQSNEGNGTGLLGLNLAIGGEDPIFGQPIGYIASITYSNAQEVRKNEQRAAPFPNADGVVTPVNAVTGTTGSNAVLIGALLNFSTRFGATTKLSLNNTFTRGADNESVQLRGFFEQYQEDLSITRLVYTQRQILGNQLQLQQGLGKNRTLDASVGFNWATRDEPDRSDLVYVERPNASGELVPTTWFGINRSATRTFSTIDEKVFDVGANFQQIIGSGASPAVVKAGALFRAADRDADTRQFDIASFNLSDAERTQSPEVIFNGTFANDQRLFLTNNASGQYTATDRLIAGYAQIDLSFGPRLRILGGARLESSNIEVNTLLIQGVTDSIIPSSIKTTDLLPAISASYQLNNDMQLRLAGSRTLSRPEYRELSPVNYFDILGGQRLFGNANLDRALIWNLDARWEWYIGSGEIVSAGVFYKNFKAPIERILVQNADGFTPDITFTNAESADNFGLELEFRKRLGFLSQPLNNFTLFANATLMKSQIRLGTDSLSSLTNPNRAMVGQSPYVVNAGLNWTTSSGWSASVLYNVFGARIIEAGIEPLPDVYDQPRNTLDFSLLAPITRQLGVKIDARNLLSAPVKQLQGGITRLFYDPGTVLLIAFKWST